MGSIQNDNVKVSRLCINQIKLLGFQDGLLFRLGTFRCDVLCIGGSKVLRNQYRKILSLSWILHKLRRRRHSWMWSVMWVVVFWRQDNKISTPSSYLTGSWKYCMNMKDRELKFGYLDCGSSMYHLDAAPVRVRWNSQSLIESCTMLFDEHHR